MREPFPLAAAAGGTPQWRCRVSACAPPSLATSASSGLCGGGALADKRLAPHNPGRACSPRAQAETRGEARPENARWYSIKLTRKNAPWVFEGGAPYTKLATLELLASAISVLAFPPEIGKEKRAETLTITGTTDNLGNRFAVSKLMTTKFPMCAVLEMTSILSKRRQRLKLAWAPREQNFEADELSNGITHRFSPKKEVKVEAILANMQLFNKMTKYGRGLYEELKERKQDKKRRKGRSDEEDRPTRTLGGLQGVSCPCLNL